MVWAREPQWWRAGPGFMPKGRSMAPSRDPWLLTPGPLTTSMSVKQAMLHDWGSRDAAFIAINREVRERLVELAGGAGTHVCVPLQGSGTRSEEHTSEIQSLMRISYAVFCLKKKN